MKNDNPRKFKIGDTVRLKENAHTRCDVIVGIVKYVCTIGWDWNDFSSHYIGFESDGYANWGEGLFELVEKGAE